MLSLNQKWVIYSYSTLLYKVSQKSRKSMVCREPPYPFRSLSAAFFAKLCSKEKSLYRTALSLSATDEVWLCQTLFVKESIFITFRTRFSKTIKKIPKSNPIHKGDNKTLDSFTILLPFSKSNQREPCLKTTIKTNRGWFILILYPGHFNKKIARIVDNHPAIKTAPTFIYSGFFYTL